ncbi:VOC family protein [Isoptericola halotolerans]|uniref:VOC family protein n=1 Tax=Isoptericola halotolerans TaxID=300560 RepID=UPI0038901E10
MSNDTGRATASAQAVWFDISSRDPQQTHDFYSRLFGWDVHPMDGDDYAVVTAGDQPPSGGIGRASDSSPYVGLVPYFPVADLGLALERATTLGATVVMDPTPTPMGKIAAVRDLEGNTVGLKES